MLMQVKVPAGFQSRCGHCAAAFHFTPTLAEVTVFGGTDDARIQADTTVMTLGETVTGICRLPSVSPAPSSSSKGNGSACMCYSGKIGSQDHDHTASNKRPPCI